MQDEYAQTLVEHAIALRPGQDLFIRGPRDLHDFALSVGEAAYRSGARSVHYRSPDPEELEQLIRLGSVDQIRGYHEAIAELYTEITKRGAASLSLVRDARPLPWFSKVKQECPESFHFFIQGMAKVNSRFNEYIRQRRFPHATAPVAVESWANRVFPESDNPLNTLWQVITHACGDIQERRQVLHERVETLNALEIKNIHVTGGGNDLKIELSRHALWTDVLFKTKSGQVFCPNFPSHEIFTVPDCRKTTGRFVASQPLRLYNFSMVRDLVLEFRDGVIERCHAAAGGDDFEKWIGIDSGASMLGEIGLVGSDAPLYGIDRYFDFTQFDENVASHIALGHGLSCAFDDADRLSDAFLTSIGCNTSAIHTDIMFGSPDVSLVASSARGEVMLLEGGVWRV